MNELLDTASFHKLFTADTPLLDVRSPVEFKHGAFPAATNIPLLEDLERQKIGLTYRQQGREAAIAQGYELLSEELRRQRMQKWIAFLSQRPGAKLYCYRGGLRSQIVQQWLADAGVSVQRIAGGYKSLRRFLLQSLGNVVRNCDLLVLAGKTGCGKTRLLNQFEFSIDLEDIARHRGSAFGSRVQAQPTQIDFENALAIQLLKLPASQFRKILLEDESHAIGSLSLPYELYERMKQAPLAVIEESRDLRTDTILSAYIQSNLQEFQVTDPEHGTELFSRYLLGSLLRIQRRLGQELYREIHHTMLAALAVQQDTGAMELHREWIRKLLQHYYDPMYEYQLGKKMQRIVFRGSSEEFVCWISRIEFRKAG